MASGEADEAAGGAPAEEAGVEPAGIWELARAWLAIGLQSFGGGTATLFLMRRETVERRRWMSEEDFARAWAMSQLAPGINLLALTILIGWRVRGAWGALVSLLGLMLPSVSITVALTASYAAVQRLPEVERALRGVVPATVGLGAALSVGLARPLLAGARREGPGQLALAVGLVAGAGAWFALGHPPVIAVLWAAGAAGAAAAWWRTRR